MSFMLEKETGATIGNKERYEVTQAAFQGVKADIQARMLDQATWLARRLKKKEGKIREIEMTGGTQFADLVLVIGSRSRRVACSVKHNSKEIGGHRVTPRTVHKLPFPGGIEATEDFARQMQSLFCFMEDQDPGPGNRSGKNEDWQCQIMNSLAAHALERELQQHNLPEIFQRIVGHEDHYLLIGGDKGARIDGYNFHGGLNCKRVSFPTGTGEVRTWGKDVHVNRVYIRFSNGFQLDWRAHPKGRISVGCLGGSLTMTGVPDGFYREET